MKTPLLICVILVSMQHAFAQTAEIRHLQQQLPSIKDSEQYVNTINRIATLIGPKSTDSCLQYAMIAKKISDRIGYEKGIAGALKNMGNSYTGKNNYVALEYANESLSIYTKLRDTANMCQLLNNIGSVNYNTPAGINYYYRAYNLGKSLAKDSVLSMVISNIIAKDTSLSTEKKQRLFDQGFAIAQKYHNVRMLLIYEETKGYWLQQAGKKSEGIALLKSCAVRAKEVGLELITMDVYKVLGEMMIDDKDSSLTGIEYLKQVVDLSMVTRYPAYTIYASRILYDHFIKENKPGDAIKYSNIMLAEYAKNQELLEQSGFTYMDYVLTNKALQDATVKNNFRKKIITSLFILTLVSFAMFFFMYRSYKHKTRLTAALQELNKSEKEKNSTLETNNAFNNKLISVIAHDLRQPFASIIMTARIIDRVDAVTMEEMKDIFQRITVEADKSILFMDGLLKWMKLQISGFDYKPQLLNIEDIIKEALEFYQTTAAEKLLQVNAIFPEQKILPADKEMLLFVTRNFISNAIKFSYKGGHIQLTVNRNNNEMVVACEDNGRGINEVQMKDLFHYYHQSDNNVGIVKSAGIALIICHDMIEKMNGRIWAESEPGKITTFYYALPV